MEPFYQDDWWTIYCGDCRKILPELEAENQVRAAVGIAPTCLDCKVQAKKFITTAAQLYDVPWEDYPAYPGAFQPRWDGEWFCPKCHHLVAAADPRKIKGVMT